jgi:hypothetical protein
LFLCTCACSLTACLCFLDKIFTFRRALIDFFGPKAGETVSNYLEGLMIIRSGEMHPITPNYGWNVVLALDDLLREKKDKIDPLSVVKAAAGVAVEAGRAGAAGSSAKPPAGGAGAVVSAVAAGNVAVNASVVKDSKDNKVVAAGNKDAKGVVVDVKFDPKAAAAGGMKALAAAGDMLSVDKVDGTLLRFLYFICEDPDDVYETIVNEAVGVVWCMQCCDLLGFALLTPCVVCMCVAQSSEFDALFIYAMEKLFDIALSDILGRDRDKGPILTLLKRALKGDLTGLIDFATRLFEGIDPRIGTVLALIKQGVVSAEKFPLEALRNFFKTTVFMTQGNFELAFHHLQSILSQPLVLKTIGVQQHVIDGLFDIIHGVVEKDPRQLVKGLPAVQT